MRSAVCGEKLTKEEQSDYLPEMLPDLLSISSKHDLSHLLVYGLKQNNLLSEENTALEKFVFEAIYRCEQIQYELDSLCSALEEAKIPFLPLKGAVIRKYYPEEWMRTSCDIDILVHSEDLEKTVSYLTKNLKYVEKERSTHDISMFSPTGLSVELHYDLVEEQRANNAIDVLQSVWSNVSLHNDSEYWYEMSEPYFYFYHIAHMAKHFETGGCGVRTFLDLWILDHMENSDQVARDNLLARGGLIQFAKTCRNLSQMWFGEGASDDILHQMQDFLLYGGAYGTVENRVALQQTKRGGAFGYILSRIFVPFAKLKRYYPILEKHPWLMPVMQVRRWFMLFKPSVASMAKSEIATNKGLAKEKADDMNLLLKNIGL